MLRMRGRTIQGVLLVSTFWQSGHERARASATRTPGTHVLGHAPRANRVIPENPELGRAARALARMDGRGPVGVRGSSGRNVSAGGRKLPNLVLLPGEGPTARRPGFDAGRLACNSAVSALRSKGHNAEESTQLNAVPAGKTWPRCWTRARMSFFAKETEANRPRQPRGGSNACPENAARMGPLGPGTMGRISVAHRLARWVHTRGLWIGSTLLCTAGWPVSQLRMLSLP